MNDLIEHSLATAAERKGDISADVYAAYFERCPESEALMSHLDHLVKGKMLDEVFRLAMCESFEDEQQYLNFEVDNHRRAYSVEPHMYANLLTALRDTVKDAVGKEWDEATEAAWQARIDALLEEIQRRH